MPSFQRAESDTYKLAEELISKYEDHADLITAKAKIDFISPTATGTRTTT